jgi:hypothetical protein
VLGALAAGVLTACQRESVRREIRVGYAGVLDVGDAPQAMAHASLEAAGYTVVEQSFATIEALVDAVSRGHVHFGTGAARAFWAAVARGARVRTVMEHVGNVHRLVVAGSPPDCAAALHGRRLALQSEGAAGTALARAWMALHCEGVTPEVVMVPGSPNRYAAALSGAVDATVLQLSDVARLHRAAPGRFSVMGDFAREWPGLMVTGLHVNTDVATSDPALVRDYIRARVLAHRAAVADRAMVLDHARRILGGGDWAAEVDEYADRGVWHVDGGLTRQGAADTLRFLVERSGLDASLTPERVADPGVLEDVLRDVGLQATSR